LSKRLIWNVEKTIRISLPMEQARNFSFFELVHGEGKPGSPEHDPSRPQ
jgi:hypothetical protein